MRKSLCACVALSALAIAAEARAEMGKPSGFADIAYRQTDFDFEAPIPDVDSDTFSIGGSVAIAGDGLYSDGTWGVQGDARVGWTDVDDEDSTDIEFGGHVFSRSQSGLIGAFFGYSSADSDIADVAGWSAGIEGLNFYDYISVYGSIGYTQIDDLDSHGWGGSVELRYFLEPNLRLDLAASAVNGDILHQNGTVWTVGFGAEYQLPDPRFPISGFVSFDHVEFDNDDIADFSADTITVGLRWNFDTSLLSRDRSGPALPIASRLTRTLGGF